MIETSQLQTLVAVANAKSFSKAAIVLNVTQSAISQSIKNLETKLNIVIFKRSGKLIFLTSEGEKLFNFANNYLKKLEDTILDLQENKSQMKGEVRIGTLAGIGKSWLAHEILLYAKDFNELSLSVKLDQEENLLKDFENNNLDILILPEENVPNHCEKVFFVEEKSSLVYPKYNFPFEISNDLNLKKIETIPLIFFENNDQLFFRWCKIKFKNIPKKLNVRFTVNSHGNMLFAVSEGLGMAVIPNHVLNRSYFKDKVIKLGEKFEISSSKLYLVYQSESKHIFRINKTIERLMNDKKSFIL